MAERKSVNKYYPPDWDPSKGSVNKYVGQHPLRDRAKKLSQGILVIRFEMPYNIWCGGCNNHIGMGVRYNAEKTKTGMYYTTPIYKFRMKCHLCDNYFEIQTDPKNHDYVILEGARRKEQRWDPKENEQIETEDKATQKKMATDAMFKLEHGSDDVQKGKKVVANLASLESRKDRWKDDFALNQLARRKFREEKKSIKTSQDTDDALLTKSSLDIPLLKERDEDVKLAGLFQYRTVHSYDEKQSQKRKEIESRPLFEIDKKMRTDTDCPNERLQMIRKQILNVKGSSNPFDRMKMDTITGGTGLSKEKLGIRKQLLTSRSKISASVETETSTSGQQSATSFLKSVDGEDDHGDQPGLRDKAAAAEELLRKSDQRLVSSNCSSIAHGVVIATADGGQGLNLQESLSPVDSDNCCRLSGMSEWTSGDAGKDAGECAGITQTPAKPSVDRNNCDIAPSVVGSSLSLVSAYSDSDSDTSNG